MKKQLLRGWAALPSTAALLLAAVCAGQTPPTPGQQTAWPPAQGDLVPRPLSAALGVVRGRYAAAVTYEDPVLRSRDDMDSHGLPREGHFALPDLLTPERTPELVTTLGSLLDAFHSANPDGPHFRLLQSEYALHVVPDTIRDERGSRVAVRIGARYSHHGAPRGASPGS